jgi:uncharacterized protein YegJ (DUF2314 family)
MKPLVTPTGRWFLLAAVLTGVLLGLAACGGGSSSSDSATSPDHVSTLPAGAASITSARSRSQSHWSQFVASFKDRPKLTYSVKVALPAKDGTGNELIWVHVTSIRGDTVKGTIDNEPVRNLGVKYGDPISVRRNQVEDWAVWDNGKVVLGGYSISPAASGGSG